MAIVIIKFILFFTTCQIFVSIQDHIWWHFIQTRQTCSVNSFSPLRALRSITTTWSSTTSLLKLATLATYIWSVVGRRERGEGESESERERERRGREREDNELVNSYLINGLTWRSCVVHQVLVQNVSQLHEPCVVLHITSQNITSATSWQDVFNKDLTYLAVGLCSVL